MRILTCRPDHFDVDYVINPWMEGQIGRVDRERASDQWHALFEDVARVATVETITPAAGQPDMCFTANAALVADGLAVPARFRMAERQGEERPFATWLTAAGIRVCSTTARDPFEGEGDALFHPGEARLWAGYGVRTSLEAHRALASRFDVEVVSLRLVDGRFYHLDTCFAPLPDGRVMYHPGAFDQRSRQAIEERVPASHRLAVDPADAAAFACNVLRVGEQLFLNAASPALEAALGDWGFEVRRHPVDEFLKAGGGVKCLSLLLEQEVAESPRAASPCPIRSADLALEGHLLDDALLRRALDVVTGDGGSFRIDDLDLAERKDQRSRITLRVAAPDAATLESILAALEALGADVIGQD